MNKILLIISREYSSRVRKKAFIIMTILGPLLFAAIMVVPAWLAISSSKIKTIWILDESGIFAGKIKNTRTLNFNYVSGTLNSQKTTFADSKASALLYIPKINLDNPTGFQLFSENTLGVESENYLASSIEKEIQNQRLAAKGIDNQVIESLKANIDIETRLIGEEGETQSSSGAATAAGTVGALMIYIFIFIYGVQVMRGVIEEKSSRIIEIMVSSVRPFQLMMGKIVGVVLVGLTQLVLWIILTGVLTSVAGAIMAKKTQNIEQQSVQNNEPATTMPTGSPQADKLIKNKAFDNNKIFAALQTINVSGLLIGFLFYFLGGYLLYSALFAAVGAAVDNETDTQQFMLPITMPLVLSFIMAQFILQDPNSSLAFWLSIIPFTSPIIMMVRLPFNPPMMDIVISAVCLVLGFLFTTWIAARIYRIGILMYGKKITFKELSKWLFYKG